MRMPERPPRQSELWQRFAAEGTIHQLLKQVPEPTIHGKYLHWDELRHRKPPEGLDRLEWWFALKMRREACAREVPLLDKNHLAFRFNLSDPLPSCLHLVDSRATGGIQQPQPVINPESRSAYLVRSLIEESITSSQLEGASTTREVAKRMIKEGREPRNRSEKMILNNYLTMHQILEIRNEEMTGDLLFEIHRMVTEGTFDNSSDCGRFRRPDERVVVGDPYGEVFHVPPPAEELERRLDLMLNFANGASPAWFIHPFVRSMILHFWLAYDHPFIDGNGRTARALFYWSMLRYGYRLFEYLSISNVILKAPARYGLAFLYSESDENDLTYFLVYHAGVVERAIEALQQDIERSAQQLKVVEADLAGLTDLNHRQRDLIAHALRHPNQNYSIEYHRSSHGVVYETARKDLMQLADRGLLKKHKAGKTWRFTPPPDLERRLRVVK